MAQISVTALVVDRKTSALDTLIARSSRTVSGLLKATASFLLRSWLASQRHSV